MKKSLIYQFRKYFSFKHPAFGLIIILLVLLFKPLLVGKDPILCLDKTCDKKISTLVSYDPQDFNQEDRLLPPFTSGKSGIHWMGTDQLGRDVAALWLDSLGFSFFLSLIAGLTALLIGLFLGTLAGYYGKKLPSAFSWEHLILLPIILYFIITIYFFLEPYLFEKDNILQSIIILPLILLGFILWRGIDYLALRIKSHRKYLNLDALIMSIIEIFESIPGLLILLSLLILIEVQHFWQIGILLGLLGWMTIARYARSEAQQIRTKKYIRDYRKFGFSTYQIVFRHFLPGVVIPVSVVMAYSISAFILAESTLSFLGIGLPSEYSSWGNLLNDARRFPKAWWMGFFPGLGIFLMVFIYHRLANQLKLSKNSKNDS